MQCSLMRLNHQMYPSKKVLSTLLMVYFIQACINCVSNIILNNASFKLSQINNGTKRKTLNFASSDTVNMSKINVLHEYNELKSCHYPWNFSNPVFGSNCSQCYCNVPKIFICSVGQVNIADMTVDFSANYVYWKDKYNGTQYHYFI